MKSFTSELCSRSIVTGALSAALLALPGVLGIAKADDPDQTTGNLTQLAQTASPTPAALPTLSAPATPATASGSIPSDVRFDPLRLHWNVPLPGPSDTVSQNLFGFGNRLNDLGIGYILYTNTFFEDNLLRHALPVNNSRGNQLYAGQEPTVATFNFLYTTFDLNRYGIPDGQIALGVVYAETDWDPLGPRNTGLATATYYQTFLNRTLELKAGINTNSVEFLSTFVAGNLAGGVFGPNASIPVEEGESNGNYVAPGVNLKANFPSNLYTKIGVQRAISPDGTVVEINQDAGGVRWKVPNSGVFVIDEVGYQVAAAPGRLRTWVRAAANYTSSNYREYNAIQGLTPRRGDHEYGLYLLGDQQILQTNPGRGTAAQGVYVGGSAMYAPPELNRFSQYYEARIYGVGLIPGRPVDLVSGVFTDNVFSGYAVRAARLANQLAHSDSKQYTIAYSVHPFPGVNINAGLSYVDHPTSVTYNRSTGSALNFLLGTVTFF